LSLSATWSDATCTQGPFNYIFGNPVGNRCGWFDGSQFFDYLFSGKNSEYMDNQNHANFNQNYQFTGYTASGSRLTHWNTTTANSRGIFNRALGQSLSLGAISQANQSSNSIVATDIIGSYLLGLQSVNAINNLDTNSNRPQLNVSYRRPNDIFSNSNSYMVPDDSTTNNIGGARARTGR
jgi:hypothetical protein